MIHSPSARVWPAQLGSVQATWVFGMRVLPRQTAPLLVQTASTSPSSVAGAGGCVAGEGALEPGGRRYVAESSWWWNESAATSR